MTSQVLQLKSSTLTSQVEDYIIDLIRSTGLKPGDNVPSELQIISDLGVSRGVVREAFRALGTVGLIEIKSGKKPKVKAFDSSVLEMILNFATVTEQVSLNEIIEIRQSLEVSCVGKAALKCTKEQEQALQNEVRCIYESIDDADAFVKHDANFHNIIAQCSGNSLFKILLSAIHRQLEESIRIGFEIQHSINARAKILELHNEICEKICNHDAKGAVLAMKEHFSTVCEAILNKE